MPRGRHRHSPPLHRLLPPTAIAGVSLVCALGPWLFSEPAVLRVTAAVAAATAAVGAAVMRRWDVEAGKRVADLTRARASDEWRHEERVAELETDLDESRELRTKLEHKLRAKRTELAGLRNEHAALLRRYATAETERASALEGRRLLEIEATVPEGTRALTAAGADADADVDAGKAVDSDTAVGAGDEGTVAAQASPVPPQGVPAAGAPWASWETASKAAAKAARTVETAKTAKGAAVAASADADPSGEGDAAVADTEDSGAQEQALSVFSPAGSALFLRANSALDRIITQRGASEGPTAGAEAGVEAEAEGEGATEGERAAVSEAEGEGLAADEAETEAEAGAEAGAVADARADADIDVEADAGADAGVESAGADTDEVSAAKAEDEAEAEAEGEVETASADDSAADSVDVPADEPAHEPVEAPAGESTDVSTDESADEPAKGQAPQGGSRGSGDSGGSPKGPSPKGDPDGPTDGGTRQGRSAEAEEPVPVLTSEEDDAAGKSVAARGHERAAAESVPAVSAPARSTGVAELTRVEPSGRVGYAAEAEQTAPPAPPVLPALPPVGHFTVPTAVAVVPAAPQRRAVVEGGFDFFGTQKGADALEAVQNEDLADVVGQEALALHKAESEAGFKYADETSRGVGQVIDLTAHDETEQIDVQGLRTAAG
ncbi:hypothetical protein ABT147_34540 [Streptomyces sp. NPDC001868]|uniref:hypothetical protein n=1 Tax=Streptomyces sp. NPDC001868 TaxID=3154401 RepID=UPI00331CDB0D